MSGSFRPLSGQSGRITSSASRAPSPFWEVQGVRNDPLVLNGQRHCQVDNAGLQPLPGMRGLGTLDATLVALREDQRRYGGVNGGGGGQSAGSGSGARNLAEVSVRRRDAIKAAFRRIDQGARGWVRCEDVVTGLQRFSNLTPVDQGLVVYGLCGGTWHQGDTVSYSTFASYYTQLGAGVEVDRDFEEMVRRHWGFSEVSDIMEDMKNKFAMVGLAYAFRHNLESEDASCLSPECFHEAIGRVGMQYGNGDVQRLFEAFDAPRGLDINKFIQHLTSAVRPPMPAAEGPRRPASGHSHAGGRAPGLPSLPTYSPAYSSPLSGGPQSQRFGSPSPQSFPPRTQSPTPKFSAPLVSLPAPIEAPPEELPGHGDEEDTVPTPVHALARFSTAHDPPQPAPREGAASVKASSSASRPGPRDAPPDAPPEVVAGGEAEVEQAAPTHRFQARFPGQAGTVDPPQPAPPEDQPLHPGGAAGGRPPAASGPRAAHEPTVEAPPEHADYFDAQPHEALPAPGEVPHAPPEDRGLSMPPPEPERLSQQHSSPHAQSHHHHHHQQTPPGSPSPGPGLFGYPLPGAAPASPAAASSGGAQPPGPQRASSAGPSSTKDTGGGRRKAVTIGINYIGQEVALDGCINDSDTFITLLTEEFGYNVSDIRQLRDDHPQRMPTLKNIKAAMRWLVGGAKEGDHLFFHYSGHGAQTPDTTGDEMDGKDESLVPVDYQRGGMLSDDELRKVLVQDLPRGARLTVILDCCHSGTALDLPYKVKVENGDLADVKKKASHQMKRPALGDVVMLSGCMDSQTSADAGIGLAGNKKAAGAMTTAFKLVITKNPSGSYHTVLDSMRQFLKKQDFPQIPQLSSEHCLNLSECFMPEAQPPDEAPELPMKQPQRKALTIGINYMCLLPGQGRLSGCINDSDTMIGIMKDTFGFENSQICRLRDDHPSMMPTRANILASMRWLTQGAAAGDELFLHFSGHGGQVADTSGDEASGSDQTLIPCDFQTAGQITDDDLYQHLVEPLPKGARMWVLFDCCHSGSALDLPFKLQMSSDGTSMRVARSRANTKRGAAPSQADVIMLSGCKDDQTSADVSAGSLGVEKAAGAMTTAFRHAVSTDITCEELLRKMQEYLRRNGYEQVPQFSGEQYIQLDSGFVNYEPRSARKRRPAGARPQSPSRAGATALATQPPPWAQQAMHSPSPHRMQSPSPMSSMGPMPGAHHSAAMHHGHGHGGLTPSGVSGSMEDVLTETRIHQLEAKIAELRLATSPAPQTQPYGASYASYPPRY